MLGLGDAEEGVPGELHLAHRRNGCGHSDCGRDGEAAISLTGREIVSHILSENQESA